MKNKNRKQERIAEPPADTDARAEALSKLSTAIALVETIALAMQSHEDEPDFGAIAASMKVACCQLERAHSDIDLAFMRAAP